MQPLSQSQSEWFGSPSLAAIIMDGSIGYAETIHTHLVHDVDHSRILLDRLFRHSIDIFPLHVVDLFHILQYTYHDLKKGRFPCHATHRSSTLPYRRVHRYSAWSPDREVSENRDPTLPCMDLGLHKDPPTYIQRRILCETL